MSEPVKSEPKKQQTAADLNTIEVSEIVLVDKDSISNPNSYEDKIVARRTDQNGRKLPEGSDLTYLIAEGYFVMQRYTAGDKHGPPIHIDRSRAKHWIPVQR